MRLILGMVLGAVLLMAGAYYHDSMSTSTIAAGPNASEHRPMVNWDVVGEQMRVGRARLHEAWNTISQRVTH